MQTTDTLLLVRPFRFRKNEETAINNYFQEDLLLPLPAQQAQEEFDNFVNTLNAHKINTLVIQDKGEYDTPDSIFPNNCISFHKRTAVLYPMFAENRRRERKLDYLEPLKQQGLTFDNIIDYTGFEKENRFLEGTGSLILDRVNRIAYCALSPRADAGIAHQFCLDLGYELFIFEANQTVDGLRKPIYHTNVMMSVGTYFAVVCTDSIDNIYEKRNLIKRLEETGKTIVDISEEQVTSFAGNILEVRSIAEGAYIVMSSQAYHSFTTEQLSLLRSWGQIIHSPLDTIERGGGGSARCMLAEVFY
ncbi:citrulline utilization hydrolase CtlX [Sphingobacterium chuzhouense]|uniref:Amidinotransferase n=1 Tax=Sphingobacterium chuzhouense TaxID=1742264 RepID=A0ABR7XRX4_9SPHI|nr:arginine deiminase-related protein [Sphingobacterium chuzhouense]MBD1421037.1 amidinotransferase [Sphingobacterium chuzhouense]